MAEEVKNEVATDVTGTEKTETTPQETVTEFDTKSITDEQFDSIYKDERLFRHPRFKALAEKAKKAEELEKSQSEAEVKALEEQKKYKELYEKTVEEKTSIEGKVKQQAINLALQTAAQKQGVQDLDVVSKLADVSGVEVDADGNITGAEEAITKLVADKPYLVGKTPPKAIGEGTNPTDTVTDVGTKTFKLSQLQDNKFFMDNEQDIKHALKNGNIVNDTQ